MLDTRRAEAGTSGIVKLCESSGSMDIVKASDVFVAGGEPTVTYNPREELALEEQVRAYLSERYKVLSISGPTKSGKTVLIRRTVDERVWVPGGDIHTLGDFWDTVAHSLGLYTDDSVSTEEEEVSESTTAGRAGIGVLGVNKGIREADALREGVTQARSRPVRIVAKEELLRRKPTIVIDDFHYIDPDLQGDVIRGLKDLVFDGVGVILASVPHRSFDAVRVEREMTGRVQQLAIPFWAADELLSIPTEGFAALNVVDFEGLAKRLVEESFSSPFLMQDFSLQITKVNGIYETQLELTPLRTPPDWDEFFHGRAAPGAKPAFDLLSKGPPRTDRKERQMRGGTTTDIYGAVLAAIAHTGPLTELSYVELRAALREVLADEVPQQHEVTRVLEQMSKIAREGLAGEPVVDYDAELSKLHISDPYFAFYLRWAVRQSR